MTTGSHYLFWCANEHQDFRIAEFEALVKLHSIELRWIEKNVEEPWVILDLPEEAQAKTLLSRSISTKFCVQIWGDGVSYDELHASTKDFPDELKQPYFAKHLSFKIYVESFKNKLSMAQRLERIESFDYLPTRGEVQLQDPDVVFCNFEYWGQDSNRRPPQPLRVFFGRCIGEGPRRQLIAKLSIKTRTFIGNTTMDPTLALLMANLSAVQNGHLVLDPFVGTGSLLLAAAQFGGFVLGGDIDYLMLHGRTRPSRVGQKKRERDEKMPTNFEQYDLQSRYLDVVVSDSSCPPWKRNFKVNAIITDPPYGIREPTTRVGSAKDNPVIPQEHSKHHIPQKVEYGVKEIYEDLINFSARRLELGGRLAFWLPVGRESYDAAKLPNHPAMHLTANCEQILSSHTSRRLLVMEKVREAAEEETAKFEGFCETSAEFREHFFECAGELDKRERKRRVKKYGHLNLLAGEEEDASE